MRIYALTYAALVAALPASAEEMGHAIELLPGHPVHHASEHEAGVTMALSIMPDANMRRR